MRIILGGRRDRMRHAIRVLGLHGLGVERRAVPRSFAWGSYYVSVPAGFPGGRAVGLVRFIERTRSLRGLVRVAAMLWVHAGGTAGDYWRSSFRRRRRKMMNARKVK